MTYDLSHVQIVLDRGVYHATESYDRHKRTLFFHTNERCLILFLEFTLNLIGSVESLHILFSGAWKPGDKLCCDTYRSLNVWLTCAVALTKLHVCGERSKMHAPIDDELLRIVQNATGVRLREFAFANTSSRGLARWFDIVKEMQNLQSLVVSRVDMAFEDAFDDMAMLPILECLWPRLTNLRLEASGSVRTCCLCVFGGLENLHKLHVGNLFASEIFDRPDYELIVRHWRLPCLKFWSVDARTDRSVVERLKRDFLSFTRCDDITSSL